MDDNAITHAAYCSKCGGIRSFIDDVCYSCKAIEDVSKADKWSKLRIVEQIKELRDRIERLERKSNGIY